MSGRWYRDVYRDAIWECETLNSTDKAIAETYARHARDEHDEKSAIADLSWLTYDRLMAKAGIGRRANVAASVARLVKAGWLTPAKQISRRATVYRLTIPTAGSSEGGTTKDEGRSSGGGTTVVPPSPSGSSTSGAGSSDGGTQPLRPSKEQTTTSPLPPAPSAEVVVGELVEEGEVIDQISNDPKTHLINEVAAQRPDWLRRDIDKAVTQALTDGRTLTQIARVLPIVAVDPTTQRPGRLNAAGLPYWQMAASSRSCPNCAGTGKVWSEMYGTTTGCRECDGRGDLGAAATGWDVEPAPAHPKAHPYTPDRYNVCKVCQMPKANERHRNQPPPGRITNSHHNKPSYLDDSFAPDPEEAR